MVLTKRQKEQIRRQLAQHRHRGFTANLQIEELNLNRFSIRSNTFRPDVMTSSRVLASFLVRNPQYYRKKKVLDIGCGSGIQGVIMGLKGARHVTFSDVSNDAVRNTRGNIRRFGLLEKSTILKGDLFENVNDRFDMIAFNHPFFGAKPIERVAVSRAMLDEGELLKRFLREAKEHLIADGVIIMPFFHFAGTTNNPKTHAKRLGYDVVELEATMASVGLQKGKFSIYALRLKQL